MTDQNSSEECLSKIIENAQNDRSKAEALLQDLISEIDESTRGSHPDSEKNERAGNTANKYIQSMQRSNEQLIKAAKILRDKEQEDDGESYNFEDFDFTKEEEVVLDEVEEVDGE